MNSLLQKLNSIRVAAFLLFVFIMPIYGQAQLIQVGTGTNTQGTDGATPYGTFWHDGKVQYLITKAELNALGVNSSGNFSSLAFNCTILPSMPLSGFSIKMGHTNLPALTGYVTTPITTVHTSTANVTLGWNTYTFQTNFTYNNVDNLVIEVCFDNAAWATPSGTVQSSTTPANTVYGTYQDGSAGCTAATLTNVTAANTNRPNMRMMFASTGGGGANPFTLPPIANFAYDLGVDTVWVRSPYAFVNTSTGDSASYWEVIGSSGAKVCVPGYSCYLQAGTTRNFRYTFNDTGMYQVKLVVRNRVGGDSLTKWVYVGNPSKRPTANFFMDKQIIGVSEQIPVYDISENGPTNWSWYLKPDCIGCNNPLTFPNDFLPNNSSQLPFLRARNAGKFDVCLRVWNDVGADSICKKDYIQVIGGLSMCASAQDTMSTEPEGYVYDMGGPNQPYFPSIMGNCFYTIDPCASVVTAYLERFRLRNQDTIIFRNGGPTGPILRRLGGGNLPDSVRTLVATSGRLYLQWQLGAPQNAAVGDSGIVIRWTSTPATYGPPAASFTSVDTAYSGQNIRYTNTTSSSGLTRYTWDANGDGVYNDFLSGDGANWTFTTLAPILRDICVIATNCKGSSTFCKRLVIMPVQARPLADFTSPRPAGFTTDTFRLQDASKNGPNQWRWDILPKNIRYVLGTDSSFQSPVFMLTYPGRYTVKLVARNNFGADSIVKVQFLDVLAYSSPSTDLPIASASDIGISRVRFADVDTITPLKTPTYTALFDLKRGTLFRGVSYTLEVSRETGNNPMERKAWIDYNLDGDFLDAGELIMNESNGTNPVGTVSFTIPNTINVGRVLRLRIGVSEGGTTLTSDKARSGCFEDYSIVVGLDMTKPVVKLKGNELYRVQRNTPYVDPWVIATDNLEGDISNRAETVTNVNMSQVGVYWAKYWVKDLYGNVSDTITRMIQVELNQVGPKITLNGSDTIRIEVKRGIYTEQGATAVDNQNVDITNRIAITGMVNVNVLGTYRVTYSVNDAFGFTDSRDRVVIVQKTYAPVLWTQSGTSVLKHQINAPYNKNGIFVKDDYYVNPADITVSQTGVINTGIPGSYNLTFVACDPLGNCSAPLFVQVDVQDTIAPNATLKGVNPLLVDVFNTNYEDPGVQAIDNYYASNSLIITKTSNVDITQLGTYQITYTVKDGSGNETVLSREVRVVDRIAPVIELLGPSTIDHPRFQDYFDAGIRISDNYETDVQLRPNVVVETNLAKRNDTLWADLGGWKYVRYQVTDASGNKSATVERIIRIVLVGLEEVQEQNGVMLYPNPNNGQFNIRLKTGLAAGGELVIYNVLGSKVHSQQLEKGARLISVETVLKEQGVYYAQITAADGKQYEVRFIVK